jgi:hypothetical protein
MAVQPERVTRKKPAALGLGGDETNGLAVRTRSLFPSPVVPYSTLDCAKFSDFSGCSDFLDFIEEAESAGPASVDKDLVYRFYAV